MTQLTMRVALVLDGRRYSPGEKADVPDELAGTLVAARVAIRPRPSRPRAPIVRDDPEPRHADPV
jgi:hypothetical protein